MGERINRYENRANGLRDKVKGYLILSGKYKDGDDVFRQYFSSASNDIDMRRFYDLISDDPNTLIFINNIQTSNISDKKIRENIKSLQEYINDEF